MLAHGNLSYNVDGDGNEFGDNLADDDMRIRSAWNDANESYPDGVIYRHMGVYGPNGEWNRDDYFDGIGAVSKDVTTVTGVVPSVMSNVVRRPSRTTDSGITLPFTRYSSAAPAASGTDWSSEVV